MTLRDRLDNGDTSENSSTRETEQRSRIGFIPSWVDPKVSFTTKIELRQFNALQAQSFKTGVSMAEFVREAIAEKLRRQSA